MVQALHPTTDKPTIRPDLRPKGNLPDSAVVLAFIGQLDKLDLAKQEVADKIKKTKQQAVNAGLVIEELDLARKLRAMDPQTVIEKYARLQHYTKAAEVPIGYQFSLFTQSPGSKDPSQQDLLDQAFREGRAIGLMGGNPDFQKYHQNSDLGMRHEEGWREGQQQLGQIFLEANEKAAKAEAEKKQAKEQKAAGKEAKAKEKAEAKDKAAAEKKQKAEAALKAKEEKAAAKKEAAERKTQERAAKKAAKPANNNRRGRAAGARKH